VPFASSLDFFDKLNAAGVPTALTAIQGAAHAFDVSALDAVEVRLHHEKVHCDDCEGFEGPGARIDRFTREIALDGELDEEQSRRLLEIADRCPVCRTLERSAEVTTTLRAN